MLQYNQLSNDSVECEFSKDFQFSLIRVKIQITFNKRSNHIKEALFELSFFCNSPESRDRIVKIALEPITQFGKQRLKHKSQTNFKI